MNRFAGKLKDLTEAVDSRLDTNYRVGMRVVKTAAAVMICLLIALLTGDWESVSIAAVSAIVTIRATQGETMSSGAFRVLGTVIGGVIGILAVMIELFLPFYNEWMGVLIIPLALILDLYLCNVLKMQDSCTISCVVTILVALHKDLGLDVTVGGALLFTLFRLRDTFIGVVVATVLNILPQHASSLLKKNRTQGEGATGDEQGQDSEDGDSSL